MKPGRIFVGLLVISVMLYFISVVSTDLRMPVKKPNPESKLQEQTKLDPVIEVKPEPLSSQSLSNNLQGWGFKKIPQQKPQITSQQQKLVKDYNIIFIANEKKKEVVLTFDLGYEEGYTERILNILKQHKVPATFFVTGTWLTNQNPKVDSKKLIKRMIREGHIVGNHSWSHPSMPSLDEKSIQEEIKRLEDLIVKESKQSREIKYFRPPKGEFSERTLDITNKMGYKTTLWSIALVDWLPMPGGPQEAIDGVVNNLHNGAVILLHGKSKDVVEGLDEMLTQVKQKGYSIVPIDK